MKNYLALAIILIISLLGSCTKYLEKKPDGRLSNVNTAADMRALLDGVVRLNIPSVLPLNCGEAFYVNSTDWASWNNKEDREAYLWDPTIQADRDWANLYNVVYYGNIVLDRLKKLEDATMAGELEGTALFFRAWAFHQLAETFAPPFQASKPEITGIPLRLDPDFNKPTSRASLEETFKRIIDDLKRAVVLLPERTLYKTRPNKGAAFALLARVYLIMGDYIGAIAAADSCLNLHPTLMDYNTIDKNPTYPFKEFNAEVLFDARTESSMAPVRGFSKTDSALYRLYSDNDLRKALFFSPNVDGSVSFRGSYCGTYWAFTGLATDEVYLIKAESLARLGDGMAAASCLNKLLEKRIATGSFMLVDGTVLEKLLVTILEEREKELVLRGLRWQDLRRLNGKGKTLRRVINGVEYNLPPSDLRYTFLIPTNVIQLAGIEQNPR